MRRALQKKISSQLLQYKRQQKKYLRNFNLKKQIRIAASEIVHLHIECRRVTIAINKARQDLEIVLRNFDLQNWQSRETDSGNETSTSLDDY